MVQGLVTQLLKVALAHRASTPSSCLIPTQCGDNGALVRVLANLVLRAHEELAHVY